MTGCGWAGGEEEEEEAEEDGEVDDVVWRGV